MASPSVMVVEDGTGKATSNSYATLAEANAYHLEMGNAAWAALSDSLKEDALVRASRAIDRLYGTRFKGEQTTFGTQAMEWPRQWVDQGRYFFYSNIIPKQLKAAACEAALRESATPGILMPDLERGGAIQSVTAGPVSVTYASGASSKTVFQALDGILAPLIKGKQIEIVLGG